MSNNIYGDLVVSPAPHLPGEKTTSKIMRYVIIALLPNLAVSTYLFGIRVVLITLVCVLSCMGFELIATMAMKKEPTINDLSAVVTGMIFAFTLPYDIQYGKAILGCFVAIVIVKQLFGGIGQNFVNPAITARVFLLVSFPGDFDMWTIPRIRGTEVLAQATAAPTPLELLADGNTQYSFWEMFLGFFPGAIGEVSAFAILIGAAFLIWKRVISPVVPICYIATVVVLGLAVSGAPWVHLFSGGIVFGAFFAATDYVTTPQSTLGKIIFGFGCGLATMMVRFAGFYTDGMIFAILIMNVLTPQIDNICDRLQAGGHRNG